MFKITINNKKKKIENKKKVNSVINSFRLAVSRSANSTRYMIIILWCIINAYLRKLFLPYYDRLRPSRTARRRISARSKINDFFSFIFYRHPRFVFIIIITQTFFFPRTPDRFRPRKTCRSNRRIAESHYIHVQYIIIIILILSYMKCSSCIIHNNNKII